MTAAIVQVAASDLLTVNFHGAELYGVERAGRVFVALKPVTEAMGLTWRKQHARITRDTILSEGITMVVIPSAGGDQETLCLDLDLVHGWLFTIDSARVRPEVRDQVLIYQRECYRVLAQAFRRSETADIRSEVSSLRVSVEAIVVVQRSLMTGQAALQAAVEDLRADRLSGPATRPSLAQQLTFPASDYGDLERFLADRVRPCDPSARLAARTFYAAYCVWARSIGLVPTSERNFGIFMNTHGMVKKKSDGIYYLGIEIE